MMPTLRRTIGLLICALCLNAAMPATAAEIYTIPAEEWLRPRSGERIASIPPIREAVADWRAQESADLVIVYAGGETGSLWAAELRDWLIALGVDADSISLRPGGRTDAILLTVEPRR